MDDIDKTLIKRMQGYELINEYDLPEAILLTKYAVKYPGLRATYLEYVFAKIKHVQNFYKERPGDRIILYRQWMDITEIDCENLLPRELYDKFLIEKLSG